MPTIVSNRKVSGREARRTLAQQREQIEQAIIPGIGLLVQSLADQETRLKALEDVVKQLVDTVALR